MKLFRKPPAKTNLSTGRIEAFSDGVFAIAITLLVLGLTVPVFTSSQVADGRLVSYVFSLWPKFLSYFISFAVIGIFWVGHHIMFHYIKRSDRNFLWLNILFLSVISFFPFPVSLIGEYSRQEISIVIYGLTLMVAGLIFGFMWLYASYRKRLIEANISDHIIQLARKIVFTAPLVYAAALLISLFSRTLTLAIYILVPIFYIWPSPIDELIESVDEV